MAVGISHRLEGAGADKEIRLILDSKSNADKFVRWDFYSRILHSLSPGDGRGHVWTSGKRLDVHIRGWPREPRMTRVGDKEFLSQHIPPGFNVDDYITTLKKAMADAFDGINIGGINYKRFHIGSDDNWLEYSFSSASREVVALCILYDLQRKARNQMELWLTPEDYPLLSAGTHKNWPRQVSANKRYFGDPSKAFQSLEAMGWPRHAPGKTSVITRGEFGGNLQEFYQITTLEQNFKRMRSRVAIPKEWRIAVLRRDNFTCKYCGRKYSEDDLNTRTGMHPQLDPDHRIPVNVEDDATNDENYLERIMTLCKTCNQRKREITKKFQDDPEHDWENEEWAYPDRPDFIIERIMQLAKNASERTDAHLEERLRDLMHELLHGYIED